MKRVMISAHKKNKKHQKHKKEKTLSISFDSNLEFLLPRSEIGLALAQYFTIINTLTGDHLSIQQIFRRFSCEGKSYLTQLLPSIGKLVDRSLEIDRIPAAKLKYVPRDREGYPTLFNGLFRDLFVADADGTLYTNIVRPESIKVLRQLLYYFYKVKEDFSEEDYAIYSEKYFAFERELIDPPVYHGKFLDRLSIRRVRGIICDLLSKIAIPEYNSLYSRPKTTHGNGAVADEAPWAFRIQRRYQLNVTKQNKWLIPRVISFPKEYTITSYTPYAVLVLVPKDSRGPRIICKENSTNMLLQQYYMNLLYNTLPEISGINFQDQTVNGRLAYIASLDNSYATIDLKDASDRVQVWHINHLFPKEWRDILLSTRSKYLVTDNKRILLRKFAAMGSALCFPVEALVFYAIAKSITDDVKVYGDDIIVPTSKAVEVMARLERFGFKVNRDKSLYRGFFKESCGTYFYNGYDVKIIHRRKWQSSIEHINELIKEYGQPLGLALYGITGQFGIVYPTAAAAVWMPNATGNTWALTATDQGELGILIPPRAADLTFFKWRFSKERHLWQRHYFKNVATPECRFFVKDAILYDEWLRLYSGREIIVPDTKINPRLISAYQFARDQKYECAVELFNELKAHFDFGPFNSRALTITQQREAVLKPRWIG